MNTKTLDFLRGALPFAITLFLWRLGTPWFNPGGMLALIPIFYCTFIRPAAGFALFAAIMCFLVDYQSDTLLYWTSVFCGCYAAYKMQAVFDLSCATRRGLGVFAIMFSVAVLIISLPHLTGFYNFFRMIWTVFWECAMYIPITLIIERATDD